MSVSAVGNQALSFGRFLYRTSPQNGFRVAGLIGKSVNFANGRELKASHDVQYFSTFLRGFYITEFLVNLDSFLKEGLFALGFVDIKGRKDADLMLKSSLFLESTTRFYDELVKIFQLKGVIPDRVRTLASIMGLASGVLIAQGSISKLREGKDASGKELSTAAKAEQYFWLAFGTGWALAEANGLERKYCKSGMIPPWASMVTTILSTGGVVLAKYAGHLEKEAKLERLEKLENVQ